jgi:hypothetical protein
MVKLDITTFLLTAGMGLFVVLLGWSDKFKEPKEETRFIERNLIEKMKIKMKDIVPFKRTSVPKTKPLSQNYFLEEIKTMTKLLVAKKVKDDSDIKLIETFKEVETNSNNLYRWYGLKYALTVVLTFTFLITGIISFFVKDITLNILQIDVEKFCLFLPLILVIPITIVLIEINSLESDFREKTKNLIEDIEVK